MNNTFISIIIPVFNSPMGLCKTLDSLKFIEYPRDKFEVIVIDNASKDSTYKKSLEYANKADLTLKLLKENSTQSSYAARNRGISNAKGGILVFLDADMTVNKTWLTEISNFIDTNKASYMGTNVIITPKNTKKPNLFEKYDIASGFPIQRYIEKRHFVPTCCLVTKKEVFAENGLFRNDIASGGDYEFGNRVFSKGTKLFYAENIRVNHPARNTLTKLIKKSFRVGQGRACLAKKNIKLIAGSKLSGLKFAKNTKFTDKILLTCLDLFLKVIKLLGFISKRYR